MAFIYHARKTRGINKHSHTLCENGRVRPSARGIFMHTCNYGSYHFIAKPWVDFTMHRNSTCDVLSFATRSDVSQRSLPSLAKAVIVSCEVFREIDNIGRITYMCYQTQEVCFSLQRREFEMESFMVGKLTVLVHSSFIYGKKQTGKLRKHIFCGNACLSYPNTRYIL